jgi:hypothetical protein
VNINFQNFQHCKLRGFENRVLVGRGGGGTFGPEGGKMAGGLRKLHNVGLHDFYSSPDIMKMKIAVFEMGHYVVW